MKLCIIYSVWGDSLLFRHSVKYMRPLVDGVIVVYSTVSNFGEVDAAFNFEENTEYLKFTPKQSETPAANETAKRNLGLEKARQLGYTHFLESDEDEFYLAKDFLAEKKRFENNPDLIGLVCRLKCYFKLPTLTIGFDTTLVPFIHKLTPELRFEFNRNYPFAWTDTNGVPFTPNRRIRIDPTRSMNITSGVEWSEIVMHHYSWVRHDVRKKVRNSTARQNIERSTIFADYCNAEPGYYCEFYATKLEACDNLFNIPDIIDHELILSTRPKGKITN